MTDKQAENERIKTLLRWLLEAETGEDSMICHDGGFRYSGDFMSMEADLIQPASLLDENDYRLLKKRGLIADTDNAGHGSGLRVTDAGRRLAHGDSDF